MKIKIQLLTLFQKFKISVYTFIENIIEMPSENQKSDFNIISKIHTYIEWLEILENQKNIQGVS